MKLQHLLFAFAISAAIAGPGAALAQSWPVKPVKIIVPLSTGTATDSFARKLAAQLADHWGQSVVVENVPGAGGNVGAAVAAKAAPDGYTLIMLAVNHSINPSLYKDTSYDLVRDFKPIVRLAVTPLAIVANPLFPPNNIGELIALAKAKPNSIVYGSGGNGSSTHLAIEMLKSRTGIQMTHVPYKSIAPMLTDILGNHISLGAPAAASVVSQVKSGKLKVLAVATAKRSSAFPDVPTVAESGVPGFDVATWLGLAAPAGTSDAVIEKVYADAAKIAGSKEFREEMREQGTEVDLLGPAAFGRLWADHLAMWAKLVKESGAKLD